MDDPTQDDAPAVPLSAVERRVLGTLIEKETTVPDTYPMTLNALVAGCNQKNNREPITAFESSEVARTLDDLKARGLVRFVHPSHGARSTKYRHVFDEHYQVDRAALALLAVLMLRGAQTLNELRTRTERAHRFASLDEVEATLEELAGREVPLVVHLSQQPGQRETRWMHLLGEDEGEIAPSSPPASTPATPAPAAPEASASMAVAPDLSTRVADLEARLAAVEGALGSVLDELGVSPSGNE